jgi:N-acetylglucosaminyl-diphospho-decaprenol L-rhamnosyltransferase
MSPPRVTALVVNYSTPVLTRECVDGLRAQRGVTPTVIVVDNSAHLEQAVRLRDVVPDTQIVETDRNRGFAAGVNAGIAAAWAHQPDFLWVVTPDVIAEPDCLAALVAAMTNDTRLGICGPAIEAAGEWIVGCRLIERLGFLVKMDSVAAEDVGRSSRVRGTDFVEGGSMLIRAEAARQIGTLRPEFFMYYEECEYCLRARDLGWTMGVVESARVHTRARRAERNERSRFLVRNAIVLARMRRRYVVIAALRGAAEAVVRAALGRGSAVDGLRAVREGLSLPIAGAPDVAPRAAHHPHS